MNRILFHFVLFVWSVDLSVFALEWIWEFHMSNKLCFCFKVFSIVVIECLNNNHYILLCNRRKFILILLKSLTNFILFRCITNGIGTSFPFEWMQSIYLNSFLLWVTALDHPSERNLKELIHSFHLRLSMWRIKYYLCRNPKVVVIIPSSDAKTGATKSS